MAQTHWNEPSRLSEDEDDSVEVHRDRRCRYATNEEVSKWVEDKYGKGFYTKKHLVRDCYFGEYTDRAYLLNTSGGHGEGYEIHKNYGEEIYCEWRRYRVGRKKFELVRKCYCGEYTDGEANEVNEP